MDWVKKIIVGSFVFTMIVVVIVAFSLSWFFIVVLPDVIVRLGA